MGDASAGWGGCISRAIGAPVRKLRELFRREYSSSDGVERGLFVSKWQRCSCAHAYRDCQ
jgi:hypothetical protein